MDQFTPGASDGPILVGIAHEDYTSTEIEEWIEQVLSWDEGDMIGQEIAKRKIRQVGVLNALVSGGTAANSSWTIADGREITTKAGWIINPTKTIKIWAYNMGSGALSTTDPAVRAQGHANLWPM